MVNPLEASAKPVIPVPHGVALGTHARIGLEGLRVGLPGVAGGILFGARGARRAPRPAGIPAPIATITSGRHMGASGRSSGA